MSRQVFQVELRCFVTLVVDDKVITQVDDDWRKTFYDLASPREIAEHLAHNIVANGLQLRQIDGFANLDDQLVSVTNADWEADAEEIHDHKTDNKHATTAKEKRPKRRRPARPRGK